MVEVEITEMSRPECFVVFQGVPPRIPVRDIMEAMCKHRGHTHDELVAPGRTSYVARSRQMVMWLADRLRPDLSFKTVARLLNRSDHSTVIWGVNKIERLIKAGDLNTILSLVEMSRRLGIEAIDMNQPRTARLTPVALEERSRRERKTEPWTTQPFMGG